MRFERKSMRFEFDTVECKGLRDTEQLQAQMERRHRI